MTPSKYKISLVCLVVSVALLSAETKNPHEKEDRIAILESRMAELEARLLEVEKQKDQSLNDVEASDGKLLWTQKKQWDEIKPGVTMEEVIELLGPPPQSLNSLKPRIDKVFFYKTNSQSSSYSLRGKISFRKDKVLTVEKPDFKQAKQL